MKRMFVQNKEENYRIRLFYHLLFKFSLSTVPRYDHTIYNIVSNDKFQSSSLLSFTRKLPDRKIHESSTLRIDSRIKTAIPWNASRW